MCPSFKFCPDNSGNHTIHFNRRGVLIYKHYDRESVHSGVIQLLTQITIVVYVVHIKKYKKKELIFFLSLKAIMH